MNAPYLIPVVGIIMGCLIPIVAMITDHRKKRMIYELHHRERMAAIDKGIEPPPLPTELFVDPADTRTPRYLLRGLIWSAIGIGMFFALGKVADAEEAWLGAIPFGIGIAYLLYYAIEGRKLQDAAAGSASETSGPRHG